MFTKITTVTLSFLLASPLMAEKINYEDHIKDIFRNSCSNCHKPSKRKGGLNLMIYEDVLKGGSSGKVVQPGDTASTLVKCVTHEEEPVMPPKGDKLAKNEIDLIKKWIKGGLLKTSTGKAVKVSSGNSLAAAAPPAKKGDIVMPQYLNLQPAIKTARANAIVALAASPYSPLIAAGGYKQVLLHKTDDLSIAGVLTFDEGFIFDLKFSRDGSLLLAAGGEHGSKGVIYLWDVKSGKQLLKLEKGYDTAMAADLSSDRKYIAVGSSDKLIKIYSAADKSLVHSIKQHSEWISAISFSPDSVLLATADRNGHLHIWEAGSGRKMYTLSGHKDKITALSWRTDSNVLASSSEDGEVILWNIFNGKPGKKFRAHQSGTTDVFFTNNNSLVTAGRDKSVKFWDGGASLKKTLKMQDSFPLQAVSSPDSKLAISADFGGNITLWDITKGIKLKTAAANPPGLSTRIALTKEAVKEAEQRVLLAEKELNNAQKKVQQIKDKVKMTQAAKNDIDQQQTDINKLKSELNKLKGKERSKASKQLSDAYKIKKELDKKYADLRSEVNRLKRELPKLSKSLQISQKMHQGAVDFLSKLKEDSIRWEAEKINTARHAVLNSLLKLKKEKQTAKATVEALELLIKENFAEAQRLTDLGDRNIKADSEDEALETLLKRHTTSLSLINEAKESVKRIEILKKRQGEIDGIIPGLQNKEKDLFSRYIKALPDSLKKEVLSSK